MVLALQHWGLGLFIFYQVHDVYKVYVFVTWRDDSYLHDSLQVGISVWSGLTFQGITLPVLKVKPPRS